MANRGLSDERGLPLPLVIGGTVAAVVLALFMAWFFLIRNTGPVESSDITRMSQQDRIKHFQEVQAERAQKGRALRQQQGNGAPGPGGGGQAGGDAAPQPGGADNSQAPADNSQAPK
jgi:hypothetical protein